jgi:hypothetical protein
MTCVEALQAAKYDNKLGARPVGKKFWYAYRPGSGIERIWGKFNAKGFVNWTPVFGPRVALDAWETVPIGESK